MFTRAGALEIYNKTDSCLLSKKWFVAGYGEYKRPNGFESVEIERMLYIRKIEPRRKLQGKRNLDYRYSDEIESANREDIHDLEWDEEINYWLNFINFQEMDIRGCESIENSIVYNAAR